MESGLDYLIWYYSKYFPEWFGLYTMEEFVKIFKVEQTRLKKLSDLPGKEYYWKVVYRKSKLK